MRVVVVPQWSGAYTVVTLAGKPKKRIGKQPKRKLPKTPVTDRKDGLKVCVSDSAVDRDKLNDSDLSQCCFKFKMQLLGQIKMARNIEH